jgi:hypothetical protein
LLAVSVGLGPLTFSCENGRGWSIGIGIDIDTGMVTRGPCQRSGTSRPVFGCGIQKRIN